MTTLQPTTAGDPPRHHRKCARADHGTVPLINEVAQRESFRFDGWNGYTGDVATFIQTHISDKG
jgi:hypothetical protein